MGALERLSSFELLEVAGLSKIWGHPFISGEDGIAKLHARTTEEKNIDEEYLILTRNLIMRDYCKMYYHRHRTWPSVTSKEELVDKVFAVAISRNLWFTAPELSEYGGEPDLIQWTNIIPLEQVSFHTRANLIPLLKDRSLAVSRTGAVRYYIKNGKIRWDTKKVLLRFLALRDAGEDLAEFMLATVESLESTRVMKETVIKLSRKEAELKAEGRWFGQTTLLNRCRMQTIEANSKKFLLHYNKHQAMTLGDLELKNRVDSFSKLGQEAEVLDEQYRVLFFRLDISGWNSAFREESCSLVTSLLDRIHGSGFYSTIMPAFQHTAFLHKILLSLLLQHSCLNLFHY